MTIVKQSQFLICLFLTFVLPLSSYFHLTINFIFHRFLIPLLKGKVKTFHEYLIHCLIVPWLVLSICSFLRLPSLWGILVLLCSLELSVFLIAVRRLKFARRVPYYYWSSCLITCQCPPLAGPTLFRIPFSFILPIFHATPCRLKPVIRANSEIDIDGFSY